MGNKSPHSILLFFMLMSLQSSILCTNNSIQTENNFNSTQTENNFNSTQTNSPFNSTPSIKPRSKHLKSNGQNRNLIAERLASKQILLSSDLETVDNGSQQNIKNKSIWLMIAGSSFLVVGVIGGFLTGNIFSNKSFLLNGKNLLTNVYFFSTDKKEGLYRLD